MAFTNEQLLAITDSGHNIIVSAGAGSGKTAVLTERIYRKVLANEDVSRLLVLTFTRPAALEMKGRIKARILKDKTIADIASKVDSSYITTFDAFALSMIKKYHYVLNLNKDIAIIDSSVIDLKKKEILDDLILKRYVENDEAFLDILTKFTKKNDSSFATFIKSISLGIEKIVHKEKYLDTYVEQHFNENFIKEKIVSYVKICNEKAQELIPQIAELIDLFGSAKITESLHDLDAFLSTKHDYNEFKIFLETFKFKAVRERNEDYTLAKERLESFKKNFFIPFKAFFDFASTQEMYDSLVSTKPYIETVICLLKEYFHELETFKNKMGLYEFNDIAMKSLELVEDHPQVREEIKNSFDEILIDEYQDTSDIQEAFISQIANNNVYMVGDIKQSIYRFRNANPYIFKKKYNDYENGKGGRKIDLTYNFRSRPEVLNNINDLFSSLMTLEFGDAEYVKSHQMKWGNTIAYAKDASYNQEFLVYEPDLTKIYSNAEIEAFTIAKKIKELVASELVFDKEENKMRKINYHDIAIILDRGTDYDLFNQVFNYFGIPLDTIADKKLSDDSLLHLFNAIFNLIDLAYTTDKMVPFYFVCVARSFLFRQSDNVILSESMDNYLNNDLRNLAKELHTYSEHNALIDTYEEILRRFNVYDKLSTTTDINDKLVVIEYVSNTINSLAKMGYSFSDLAKHFKDIINNEIEIKNARKDSGNGVVLINIHKSKGLEYPICFFAGLYRKFNLSDMKDSFLYNKDFGFVTPYFTDRPMDTIDKILLKDAYLKAEISERIRLIYVAMTRAREKMYFVMPYQESDKIPSSMYRALTFKSFFLLNLDYLLPFMKKFDYDSYMTKDYLDQKALKQQFSNGGKFIYPTNNYQTEVLKKGKISKVFFELMTEEERKLLDLGTRMHAALESIDLKKPDLSQLALTDFEQQLLKKVLALPCFSKLDEAKIYQEQEFYYQLNGKDFHGIIDLLVEYPDHFEIIDYKLYNTDKEEYTRQLNVYYDYVRMISDKPIKMMLLSLMKASLVAVERI